MKAAQRVAADTLRVQLNPIIRRFLASPVTGCHDAQMNQTPTSNSYAVYSARGASAHE